MEPQNLIGSLKAAILVHALGWDVLRPVMSQLNRTEQNTIFKLSSRLGEISPELVESVAREFIEKATPPKKQIENKSKNRGNDVTDGFLDDLKDKRLKSVQSISPNKLIQHVKNEHPQTISLILAHLDPKHASEVIALLPDELKSDVAWRIANLDNVSSGMLDEIDLVFEEIISKNETSTVEKAGGVPRLAEILNMIDVTTTEQIIEDIEEEDPDLAEEIRQNMFVFDDIILVDDRGLQKVLRIVESQELATALKSSAEEVKEKIFRNLSERASEILQEEIEVLGSVRMKEVDDAQRKITKIIQHMEKKGDLVVSGRGGEEFVG